MSVLPNTRIKKVEFCEQHLTPWAAQAVNIGTTSAAVTDLQTKTEAARAAYQDAKEALNTAKAKTNQYYVTVRAMTTAAADIIKAIKTKAATAGDGIYTLAEIPAPATPTPVGELAKPSDFKVTLDETGAINLQWKCAQPRGATAVTYQVWRKIGTAGAWACLGGSGTKKFADNTLPAGSASATYKIQATRSTSTGPWAQYTVSFGVEGGEATIASVVETTPTGPKMAA
jgi:hypothetical protein